MRKTRIVAWTGVAVVLLAVASLAAWRGGLLPLGHEHDDSGVVGGADIGGEFTLTDQRGETVRDADFRGNFMLIYFGYTNCPDICVPALQNMSGALDELGEEGERIVPIFITVDPERDTVALLAEYAENFHPRLVALTGGSDTIADVVSKYRVYAKLAVADESSGEHEHDDYLVEHSGFVYLMDPDGGFVMVMSHATDPEEMARKIAEHL